MAAATVTNRRQNRIAGDLRVFMADSVVFANTGDTLTVPGMHRIASIDMTPTTNASFGFTISGAVITLTAGAGLTFLARISGL